VISTSYINNSGRHKKLLGIAGALLTLAIPYFILLRHGEHIETAQSLCPFKMITGFPCPGCGITKSLIFLFKGDFYKSLEYHLFGPLTFLFCITIIAILAVELITKKEYLRKYFFSKKIAYTLGGALIIYHFTRLIYFISSNSIDEILRESVWK
jgi:hypothetical protein